MIEKSDVPLIRPKWLPALRFVIPKANKPLTCWPTYPTTGYLGTSVLWYFDIAKIPVDPPPNNAALGQLGNLIGTGKTGKWEPRKEQGANDTTRRLGVVLQYLVLILQPKIYWSYSYTIRRRRQGSRHIIVMSQHKQWWWGGNPGSPGWLLLAPIRPKDLQ